MRLVVASALVIAPALAAADPKFHTTLTVEVDEETELSDEIDDMLRTEEGTRLDRCWRKDAVLVARVIFEKGKVAKVAIDQSDDRRANACLTKAMRGLTLSTESRVIASVHARGTERLQELFTHRHSNVFQNIIGSNMTVHLGKFQGIQGGGSGTGISGGVGIGTGTVGSKPHATGTGGSVSVGGTFTPAVDADLHLAPIATSLGPPGPTPSPPAPALTADMINRVVKARAGVFRACYQKELNRNPKLGGGKVVIKFTIQIHGTVAHVTVSSTTLNSAPVEQCLVAQFARLKFPAHAGNVVVSYPLLFSPAP
jgi:hypothetical protein